MFVFTSRTVLVLTMLLHSVLAFSQTPECLKSTFLKTWGTETQAEYGTVITLSSDGNIYIAGRNATRTFIQKVTLAGDLIWMREFVLNNFEPITPMQIFEDSEGMIVGCGTQAQFAGATRGFVFRYDPIQNVFLWAHPITSNNPTAAGILEKGPDGSYVYYQNPVLPDGETEIEILDLDRATGLPIPAFASRYEHISYDLMTKMVMVNGSLFGLGTVESRDSFLNQTRRLMMARFDPVNGMPVWTKLSHLDTTQSVDFLARDMIEDGDSLVAVYLVDENPADVSPTRIHLQKTDLDGNIRWVKKYDFSTSTVRIIAVSGGYILSGQRNFGGKYFVFKVDKNGEFVWGRDLSYGSSGGPNVNVLGPNQAVTVGDSLYFTGVAATGVGDVLLWKILTDGSMADTCGYIDTLVLPAIDVPGPVSTSIDLQQLISTAVFSSPLINWTNATLDEVLVCPDCTVPDPCPQDNDFAFEFGGIDCVGGQIQLAISYCDLNGDPISDGMNITFYNGNPFTTSAVKLATITHDSLAPGILNNCSSLLIKDLLSVFGADALQNGVQIFAVVNDPGTADTPFSLNDFPLSELSECDYTNNVDSIFVQLPSFGTVNLGADQTICSYETIVLDAGPGFFKYQWSNGTSAQTATIGFAGQYRVTVTDACGFRQIDTVNVQVKQLPLIVENGQYCPGKSVTIRGFTFDQAGTFQRTIPGLNTDCDTAATFFISQLPYEERDVVVHICPFSTVTINGVVYDDPGLVRDTVASSTGCDTIVFYFINQLPLPFRFYEFNICPGDAVTFHGNVYDQAVTFTDTLYSTGVACDTIAYVTINMLARPERADTIRFCPGTSVQVGGQTYTQPGQFQLTAPSGTGFCDTIVTYTLEWLPAPALAQTISFCPGTSVDIDGQTYTQPGTVLSTIPGTGGGCDTLVTYTLEWLPAPTRAETLEFCEGESITIGGQTYTHPIVLEVTISGSGGGCDTLVTYTLKYLDPGTSTLQVSCPASITATSSLVTYNLPTATSDCTCPGIGLNLSNGLASGSVFPAGNTQVCFTAKDSCGSTANCCFSVNVQDDPACDTKTIGCMKYELLSITANAKQQRTYRIRVSNSCANKLIFTAIQIPDGVTAVEPDNLSTYTSPDGRNYAVRNPNYSPFYSIRFKSTNDSIANGASEVFEYTLPAQVNPTFINISTRLAPQTFYSAHLNTFKCPIGVTPSQNRGADAGNFEMEQTGILLFPNPAGAQLYGDLSRWQGQQLSVQILDSRGVRLQSISIHADSEAQEIPIAAQLPSGLYFLQVLTEDGSRETGRFILER